MPPDDPRIRDPIHLTPVLVPKPWGGRRLARLNHALPPDQMIGESWEVADLDPKAVSSVAEPATRVAAGPFTGCTLSELIALDVESLLGKAADVAGRFPLLIKFLDAREHLSVQVHPTESYAASDPTVHVKTESWIVLDAEPGAEVMIGFASGVTRDAVLRAIGTPDIVPMLRRVPAVVGAVHHIPAGTVHALGAGVLVAEIQTPSDTTFRLYDWAEEYQRAPRTIHYQEAARTIELAWLSPAPLNEGRRSATPLVDTPSYVIRRLTLQGGERHGVEPGIARVLIVMEGGLQGTGFANPCWRGEVVLLPAAWSGPVRPRPSASFLEVVPGIAR